jgi:hypothetical protein
MDANQLRISDCGFWIEYSPPSLRGYFKKFPGLPGSKPLRNHKESIKYLLKLRVFVSLWHKSGLLKQLLSTFVKNPKPVVSEAELSEIRNQKSPIQHG